MEAEWEDILSAAARLQKILPDAVLVGGTAAAMLAHHRISADADHVLGNLRDRFDAVLATLESVAGWKTARVNRPVLILGSLDGIDTGIRQLIRSEPLETEKIAIRDGLEITVPTPNEILRIKGVLILRRNAARDYIDFAAMADRMGGMAISGALEPFDRLYPQENGQSALMQLQVQLAAPKPYDLESVNLDEYKGLEPAWREWSRVESACVKASFIIADVLSSGMYAGREASDRVGKMLDGPEAIGQINQLLQIEHDAFNKRGRGMER
jgi:hypothetical protein